MPTLEHLKICKIKDLMFFALLSLKLQKEKQIYKPDSTFSGYIFMGARSEPIPCLYQWDTWHFESRYVR